MAVKETGVSYYGLSYPEHAQKDFQEMKGHNCTAVILALTEFDIDFWFPNIVQISRVAKDMGLKVYLDLWGIGKFFGGEPVSLFLQNNIHNRQVSALTGEPLNAACFNTKAFRDYFFEICEKLSAGVEADGFFWDEPHYALPKSYASITGGAGDDWTCRCPVCKKMFEELYGYSMPKILTREVIDFRQDRALDILQTASQKIKAISPESKITCCVHATLNTYYVTENRGYDNWDKVGKIPEFDIFSSTIISWDLPLTFFKEVTERTVAIAKKYNKVSQRWVLGYYKQPPDMNQIKEVVKLYSDLGVESIFAWTYRGGKGTVLAAPDADLVWKIIGDTYGEVLER